MDVAVYGLTQTAITAHEFEQLPDDMKRQYRGNLACAECGRKAIFRKSGSSGNSANFSANHELGCPCSRKSHIGSVCPVPAIIEDANRIHNDGRDRVILLGNQARGSVCRRETSSKNLSLAATSQMHLSRRHSQSPVIHVHGRISTLYGFLLGLPDDSEVDGISVEGHFVPVYHDPPVLNLAEGGRPIIVWGVFDTIRRTGDSACIHMHNGLRIFVRGEAYRALAEKCFETSGSRVLVYCVQPQGKAYAYVKQDTALAFEKKLLHDGISLRHYL